MCLSFYMVKKIIERIANAIRKAYKILYEQLISHCINKKIKYFMTKISSLTQDSIIYEIALQTKKLKVK